MSSLDKFKKQVEIGQAIFFELAKLNDSELKEKVKSILDHEHKYVEIIDHARVKRIIEDEKYTEISMYFYDGLIIYWHGIIYKPEHGDNVTLVKFTEHFKL